MQFFIEMGQGIIRGPGFWVSTSVLYSCTLIAGVNAGSGRAGAFHYPADALAAAGDPNGTVAAMDTWAAILAPTQIILVEAPSGGYGPTIGPADQANLQTWATGKIGTAATVRHTTAAGMEKLAGGHFDADRISNLQSAFNSAQAIDVSNLAAGRYLQYGGITLVGRNQQ